VKPINLNQIRKARSKAEDKARADVNAVKHGRSKAQRLLDATKIETTRQRLDQLRFEDDQPE
jgi:hypothetical protein